MVGYWDLDEQQSGRGEFRLEVSRVEMQVEQGFESRASDGLSHVVSPDAKLDDMIGGLNIRLKETSSCSLTVVVFGFFLIFNWFFFCTPY